MTHVSSEFTLKIETKNVELAEVHLASDVEIRIQVDPADKGWLLQCNAQGSQTLECSRSLDEFASPFNVDFQVLVENDPKVSGWKLDDSEEEIFHIRLHPQAEEFSIVECLRQQILLDEPLNPISNPKASFAWDDPDAPTEDVDPRWAGLLKLKKTDSAESKK